ncbi:histidine kinase dimerization/phosphoacceptor domain-containing protein [Catenulispora pinistramenti]|uniref:histidine kinase dimerization/phosphoacceptor domain-containing protein n=1 Tax=Catenulispora pinistramenti TaxID=2705254 RepID=UPI002E774777|nr:histidine kinase dimerization/phosphoacceptor domain-containing protein [Catenulispora pinistramenti]
MARDMHDVLGHTVSVITLTSGLARRMLEAGSLLATVHHHGLDPRPPVPTTFVTTSVPGRESS